MSSANVIKINHSNVEDRRVKMSARNFSVLFFLCSLVTIINGFGLRRERLESGGPPTAEECSRPPMSKYGHECCRLPKERIWGDLRPSLNKCFKNLKGLSPARQEEVDEGREMMTPEPNESASTSPTPPTDRRGMPNGRRPFSDRLKNIFSTIYKDIKNTIDSIRQSVVSLTDHLRRRAKDSCFMECVFEDQGFLVDKILNKSALLERLGVTLGQNEPWHKVAVEAVETCSQMEIPNNGTCNSGSEEMFRCVLKQIFFNCPNWTQNDYCISLREFYQKCPDGPPPEINDNHSTAEPLPEEEMATSPSTESESE